MIVAVVLLVMTRTTVATTIVRQLGILAITVTTIVRVVITIAATTTWAPMNTNSSNSINSSTIGRRSGYRFTGNIRSTCGFVVPIDLLILVVILIAAGIVVAIVVPGVEVGKMAKAEGDTIVTLRVLSTVDLHSR